jgi:hypothetical protein
MEWVLIVLVALVAIVALLVVSLRISKTARPAEELAPEERSIQRRLARRQREIEEAARAMGKGAMAPIALQATDSSREIVSTLASALSQRQTVRRALLNKSMFERDVQALRDQLANAKTDDERQVLSGAISAKSMELNHYDALTQALSRMDAIIAEAEASLTETRARILAVSTSAAGADLDVDGLRANLNHLGALRASVDEVQVSLT